MVQEPVSVFVSGHACSPAELKQNNTFVQCRLPAGVGAPESVVVSSQDQFSLSEQLVSYRGPTIAALNGCTQKSPLSLVDCNRNSHPTITISGSDFGSSGATVLIGTDIC